MHDAPGVGLAAPQIGLALQLAVIEDREEYLEEIPEENLTERERRPVPFHVLINPTIREAPGKSVEFYEGCLNLAGFTALTLAVPPAEVVGILNRFFRVVIEVVEGEGGMVNKFQGDAALCVFGAPVIQPSAPRWR